jgi:hypothetical protein
VWRSGATIQLRFDFRREYDLEKLHFWNYTSENFDVDTATFTFFDSDEVKTGELSFSPQLGASPIFAEDVLLENISKVRYVDVLLSGSNNEVDFQNIGFTGKSLNTSLSLIFQDHFE